jgi:hypothetical protein
MATKQPQTPGVYINEPTSFPPSIVAVETAVPAFIGYTEKALQSGAAVNVVPVRISSLADYVATFGGAHRDLYYLSTDAPAAADSRIASVTLDGATFYNLMEEPTARFYMYDCMRHFFANGGGDCYVVSCATYETPAAGGAPASPNQLTYQPIKDGLDAIANVVGPTMLVVPDATLLSQEDNGKVVQAMLNQCGARGDRVALLDVFGSDQVPWSPGEANEPVDSFRTMVGGNSFLEYGMAYFPFLNTSVVDPNEITMDNFDTSSTHKDVLVSALKDAVHALYPDPPGSTNQRANTIIASYISQIGLTPPTSTLTNTQLMNGLTANIPSFAALLVQIANGRNVLPPSPAMAGIFATVDNTRGVWNAPANIGIGQLISPVFDINHDQQQDLNAPPGGIAINAIRTFPGRGTLVWGARTLLGNSDDWRYIQVRRTMIYVEQSIKLALNSFVFGPNTPSTWVTVVSMIESFLHGLWSAGGLMGATAEQAYNVQSGLGSTMTSEDVLQGIMRVQVVLTMVHPAEFIELTFEQQMLGGS